MMRTHSSPSVRIKAHHIYHKIHSSLGQIIAFWTWLCYRKCLIFTFQTNSKLYLFDKYPTLFNWQVVVLRNIIFGLFFRTIRVKTSLANHLCVWIIIIYDQPNDIRGPSLVLPFFLWNSCWFSLKPFWFIFAKKSSQGNKRDKQKNQRMHGASY